MLCAVGVVGLSPSNVVALIVLLLLSEFLTIDRFLSAANADARDAVCIAAPSQVVQVTLLKLMLLALHVYFLSRAHIRHVHGPLCDTTVRASLPSPIGGVFKKLHFDPHGFLAIS